MKTQVLQLVCFVTLMLLLNSCVSAGPSPSEESALTVTSEPVVNMAAASADTPPVEPTSTPTLPTSTSRPTTAPATDTPRPRLSVSGLILDHVTGQPVAGAEVSAGTTTATTGSNGRYTLANLTPGQYVVSVVHQDYDPALSPILFLGPGRLMPNLELYPIDETPYPEDPMLTNPINPNGAPTKEDAERLAREQGLSGEVVRIEETKLNGEFLVNYKLDDDIRAAIAELNHEVWKLTDETGQEWFIIKICGNLANRLAKEIIISTPQPCPLPLLAEVLVDSLTVYACASQECAEVTRVQFGDRVEVTGCLVEGSWCKVTTNGKNGWCTGQSLQSLAVSTVIPLATPIMPTPTPETIPAGKGRIIFNSVRNGERTHYIINIDGSGLAPFTEIHGGYGDWSSDGNQLVFSHETDIYRMNYDGSGLTNLTNYSASDIDPIWSPDDRQILFRSNRDEPDPENCMKIILNQCNYEIYVMNSDGSGLTNLTRDPGFDADHAWLQNGQIIFSRNGSLYHERRWQYSAKACRG